MTTGSMKVKEDSNSAIEDVPEADDLFDRGSVASMSNREIRNIDNLRKTLSTQGKMKKLQSRF